MVADPRSLTRTMRSEAKRGRIVDAALRRFAEDGYQGARVEDVAADLGIAKGSVFQHFGSKAGLEMLVSILDWLTDRLQDALITEEMDPGLFHRWVNQPERQRERLEHFTIVLRSAIGAPAV